MHCFVIPSSTQNTMEWKSYSFLKIITGFMLYNTFNEQWQLNYLKKNLKLIFSSSITQKLIFLKFYFFKESSNCKNRLYIVYFFLNPRMFYQKNICLSRNITFWGRVGGMVKANLEYIYLMNYFVLQPSLLKVLSVRRGRGAGISIIGIIRRQIRWTSLHMLMWPPLKLWLSKVIELVSLRRS